jgi:glyoxylase-like metal-dependent hydrolase (beta-lactamase superfamily II)
MELTPNLHAFLWTSPTANNCNTYLIRSPEKTILIDPGHAAYFDHVSDGLRRLGISVGDVDLVVCSHAHPDHLEAVRLFADAPALFALHRAEWNLVEEMAPLLKASMSVELAHFTPDFYIDDGALTVGSIDLMVHHTPGHSPGGVCLYWPAEKALFSGDLIFKGGLGRTDLPGGDAGQLKESIRRMEKLESAWLLPGHGEVVSGTKAVAANFTQVEHTWFGYF